MYRSRVVHNNFVYLRNSILLLLLMFHCRNFFKGRIVKKGDKKTFVGVRKKPHDGEEMIEIQQGNPEG